VASALYFDAAVEVDASATLEALEAAKGRVGDGDDKHI
jgi:hypothetical protein